MSARGERIGLALGSGSARGWAHIGVIRALEAAGIRPSIVAGTSIGALVGGAYALGKLDELETWVGALRVRDVIGFLDVGRGSGLIKGERLMAVLGGKAGNRAIEDLALAFGVVAAELETGEEIWLRSGATLEAVRASFALPGLFPPVVREGKLLVDGGLVNPVPISLARAMGAEAIIAVDLGSEMVGSRLRARASRGIHGPIANWMKTHGVPMPRESDAARPSPLDVFVSSMQVMQARISRNRIASDAPNVLVTPHLSQMALLDFHRAKEAIEEGRRSVVRVARELENLRDRGLEGSS